MDKQRTWLSLEGARARGIHKPRSSGKDGVCKRWDTLDVRHQNRIANNGVLSSNLCYSQMIGQVAGANDVNPIVKDKESDWRADQVIPMHQRIDQQFFEH